MGRLIILDSGPGWSGSQSYCIKVLFRRAGLALPIERNRQGEPCPT